MELNFLGKIKMKAKALFLLENLTMVLVLEYMALVVIESILPGFVSDFLNPIVLLVLVFLFLLLRFFISVEKQSEVIFAEKFGRFLIGLIIPCLIVTIAMVIWNTPLVQKVIYISLSLLTIFSFYWILIENNISKSDE